MFGKKTAAALDSAAAKAHEIGTNLAGQTGGRIADAVATATLGSIRGHINEPCTRPDCDHD